MSNFSSPYTQTEMILDTNRTNAFYQALLKSVSKSDVVLDLGSGSGVLSFIAATLGAKKIYAIESTNATKFIKKLSHHNGFQRKIKVIKTDIINYDWSDVKATPTLIISETIGHFAPGENIHQIFNSAFKKFNKNLKIIPYQYKLLFFACNPQKIAKIKNTLNVRYDIDFTPLLDEIISTPTYIFVEKKETLSKISKSSHISLYEEFPINYALDLIINKKGIVNAIGVGFDVSLIPGINIVTSPLGYATTWSHLVLPLRGEFDCLPGDKLSCKISFLDPLDKSTWTWDVSHFGGNRLVK